MKPKNERPSAGDRASETAKIYAFEKPQLDAKAKRHEAIHNHLVNLPSKPGAGSAVAVACVLLFADGTLDVSARGIEPIIAEQMAAGMETLANAIRWHGNRPPKSASPIQRGAVSVAMLISMAFAFAAYVNPVDWLDAVLVVLSHVLLGAISRQDN